MRHEVAMLTQHDISSLQTPVINQAVHRQPPGWMQAAATGKVVTGISA
jgi:hypothetical protein